MIYNENQGMPNKVFLNKDGIVEQLCEGDQTSGSIQDLIKETNKITTKLQEQKRKVLILNDFSKVEKADYGAKKASLEGLTNPKHYYDRVGIFGASPFMRFMGASVIKGAGAEKRVKIFTTREEVLAWLKEKKV